MKNIHIIPTDKPSRLALLHDDKLHIGTSWKKDFNVNPQNIYITSDEEIKDGDWFYNTFNDNQPKLQKRKGGWRTCFNQHKIILTTNPYLIKDGVQAIDDEFLEWFVKNPSCEEVETIYGLFNPMGRQVDPNNLGQNHSQCVWKYKIIIPKEEPKQETLSYTEAAKKDERIFNSTMMKQETIEEAKKVYQKALQDNIELSFYDGVNLGAELQAEGNKSMYSEEEVENILIEYVKTNPTKPYKVIS